MMDAERYLASITLAHYIFKAMALIDVPGKGGINTFRHQIFTLGILLDYKIIDAVLLKAAVIHDLFEDKPEFNKDEIINLDSDGPEVYELVMEVTIRSENGVPEDKSQFLSRIMNSGSSRAKILKLADRISSVSFLGFVHDTRFVKKVLRETKTYILPHAKDINENMHRELSDLVADRTRKLKLIDPGASV
jgi:(p)ppGpp synthase/HD superfamily hydrolase